MGNKEKAEYNLHREQRTSGLGSACQDCRQFGDHSYQSRIPIVSNNKYLLQSNSSKNPNGRFLDRMNPFLTLMSAMTVSSTLGLLMGTGFT